MSRFVFFAISALLVTIGFSETSNACSGSRCSYYQWYGGSCGEFTPAGNLVQWMNESSCRQECGVIRRR